MNIYLKIIYNYIAIYIGSSEDAKDIMQETVLSVWLSIKNFSNQSTFKTWVLAITKRKISDFYRKIYGIKTECINDYEDMPEDSDDFEKVNDKLMVSRALKALNQAERELLYLAFNAGMNYTEISEITGIPVGTVKSRISRIKDKLRKQIGEII